MKKIIFLSLCLFFLFSCEGKKKLNIEEINTDTTLINSVEDHENTDKINNSLNSEIMYVCSPEGLNVRDIPSIDGNKVALLPNFSEVIVTKIDTNEIIIDGIPGNWKFVTKDKIQGWVFGGYLSSDFYQLIKSYSSNIVCSLDNLTLNFDKAYFYNFYEDEIVILITSETYDINYPLNQQKNDNFNLFLFWHPFAQLETCEYEEMMEGLYYHTDTKEWYNFKTRKTKILFNGTNENIYINTKINLYDGIQRRTKLEEVIYIGDIEELDIQEYKIAVWRE